MSYISNISYNISGRKSRPLSRHHGPRTHKDEDDVRPYTVRWPFRPKIVHTAKHDIPKGSDVWVVGKHLNHASGGCRLSPGASGPSTSGIWIDEGTIPLYVSRFHQSHPLHGSRIGRPCGTHRTVASLPPSRVGTQRRLTLFFLSRLSYPSSTKMDSNVARSPISSNFERTNLFASSSAQTLASHLTDGRDLSPYMSK